MKKKQIGKKIIALIMVALLAVVGNLSLIPASAAGSTTAADVVFVIDSTGSMSEEIQSVRDGVADFVEQLINAKVDLRVGIMEYGDITCDGMDSTIIYQVNSSPWHYTIDEIRTTLDEIYAKDGGDLPETLVDALGYITTGAMKFRSGAHKFAFVLTDASYKMSNRHGYNSMYEVVQELQKMQISTSVITPTEYFDKSWQEGDDEEDDYFDAISFASTGAGFDDPASSVNPGYVSPLEKAKQVAKEKAAHAGKKDMDLAPVGDTDLSELSGATEIKESEACFANISTGGDYDYYAFTPEKTGIYSFSSSGSYDTYGYLYNESGTTLCSDDDSGESNNFKIRAALKAGTKYYFGVRFYSDSEIGEFPVSVVFDRELEISNKVNPSYREIAAETNGILEDIYEDFATTLFNFAKQILEITYKAKKAIYVLPGYMGSELYTAFGDKVWVDTDYLMNDVAKYLLPLGDDTILKQNEDGTGSKVRADITKDHFGTQETYKNLINTLKENCSDEYDVIFFPYNWLGDISDAAEQLEKHIQINKYEKVILVTHSTGGLLAADYIARSNENKKKVEKAVLIAPPLLGTLTSLQPIETGQTQDLDQMLTNNGVNPGPFGITHKVIHDWVKAVTKNSPITYQLLPSVEYLRTVHAIYEGEGAVTTKSRYYEILNSSENINTNLTNGNTRSHDYFRSTILGDDIIKVLKSVDTLVVCSQSGHNTPAICVYSDKSEGGTILSDIIYKSEGDGTVMGFSATAQRAKGVYELPYRDFPGVSHGDLASNATVLSYITDQINDTISSSSSKEIAETGTGDTDDPLSSFIKMNFSSDKEYTISVTDENGNPVNIYDPSLNNVIYTVLHDGDGDYRSILYVPSSGWKVSISGTEDESNELNGSITVSTLDNDGYKVSSAEYPITIENDADVELDMSSVTVTDENLGELIPEQGSVKVEAYDTEWDIDNPTITLSKLGQTAVAALTGSAVTKGTVKAADLTWGSSNTNVATVNGSGDITAVGYGTATITAVQDGSFKTVSSLVTVRRYASAVKLPDLEMEPNEKVVLSPEFDAEDVTETTVTYQAEDESVVSIEGDVITALKVGTTTVTATATGGATATFSVTVADNDNVPVESIVIDEGEGWVILGSTRRLNATITPDNATNKDITWNIVDPSVVEIVSSDNTSCTIRGLALGATKLYAVSSDGGFSVNVDVVVTDKLDTPILKSALNTVDGVAVSWDKSNGADKYRVFRKTPDTDWEAFGDTSELTFTDKTVESGKTYIYTVCCLTNDGEDVASDYNPEGITAEFIAAPVIIGLQYTSSGVALKWSAVSGAAKYRVFRKAGAGKWANLIDTTATSVVDKKAKSGTKYTYTVRCVNADGTKYTSDYDKTGKSITFISQPKITKLENTSAGTKLTLSKVTGAAKYRVFRKAGAGKWAKLVDTTATSVVDKKVKSGTKYAYTVRCISKDGKSYTSDYDKTGKSITFISQPKITRIQNVLKGTKLSWSKSSGAASYRVFLKNGKAWKQMAVVKSNTYTYTKAKSGKTYAYTVRAVGKDGKTLSAYNAGGWKQKYVAAPALPTLKNTKNGVQISFKKVAGAAKYRVFCKLGKGKWVKLTDTTKLTVLHKAAKKGKTYSYTVRCLSKDGKTYTSAYNTKGKSIKCKR